MKKHITSLMAVCHQKFSTLNQYITSSIYNFVVKHFSPKIDPIEEEQKLQEHLDLFNQKIREDMHRRIDINRRTAIYTRRGLYRYVRFDEDQHEIDREIEHLRKLLRKQPDLTLKPGDHAIEDYADDIVEKSMTPEEAFEFKWTVFYSAHLYKGGTSAEERLRGFANFVKNEFGLSDEQMAKFNVPVEFGSHYAYGIDFSKIMNVEEIVKKATSLVNASS